MTDDDQDSVTDNVIVFRVHNVHIAFSIVRYSHASAVPAALVVVPAPAFSLHMYVYRKMLGN